MPEKQSRGTDPVSIKAVVSFLSLHPGSTIEEIKAGTKLARPTVAAVLNRLAEPSVGRPRQWHLRFIPEQQRTARKPQTVPLKQTWGRWTQAMKSWPIGLSKLSQSTSPREIAAGLEALAANAAALAVSFRAVQDEPDWLERIGG